jgi:hypothetical protein
MTYMHLTFGEVVRSGPTKWLKCGPAVPCVDPLDPDGKTRLLLVEPQYWGSSRPIVEELEYRSPFGNSISLK